MSLLMQALKRAENAKQKPVAQEAERETGAPSIRAEELSLADMTPRDDMQEPLATPRADGVMAVDDVEFTTDRLPTPAVDAPMAEPEIASPPVAPVYAPTVDHAAPFEPAPFPSAPVPPVSVAPATESAAPASRSAEARAASNTARQTLEQARQQAQARDIAKNVFVAKEKPARTRPVMLLVGGLLFAGIGIGGFYLWQMNSQPASLFTGQLPPAAAVPPASAGPAVPAAPAMASTAASTAVESAPATAGTSAMEKPVAAEKIAGPVDAPQPVPAAPSATPVAQKSASQPPVESRDLAPTRQAAATTESAGDPLQIQIRRTSNTSQINPALTSAYQAFSTGELDVAQQQYRKVLQQEPNNRDALLGLAAIALGRAHPKTAADFYARLLELDPADPDAIAGMINLQQGDPSLSESRLKNVIAQQPQAGGALFALGNLYARQQRWADAQQAYFRAYTTAANNADYAFNLAVSLDKLDQAKLALEYYQKALALKSGNFNKVAAQSRIAELQAAPN